MGRYLRQSLTGLRDRNNLTRKKRTKTLSLGAGMLDAVDAFINRNTAQNVVTFN